MLLGLRHAKESRVVTSDFHLRLSCLDPRRLSFPVLLCLLPLPVSRCSLRLLAPAQHTSDPALRSSELRQGQHQATVTAGQPHEKEASQAAFGSEAQAREHPCCSNSSGLYTNKFDFKPVSQSQCVKPLPTLSLRISCGRWDAVRCGRGWLKWQSAEEQGMCHLRKGNQAKN